MSWVASITDNEKWVYGIFAAAIVAVIFVPLVNHRLALRRDRRSQIDKKRRLEDEPQPDMKVSDAIDYIVNDLSTELAKPAPPKINGFGPGTVVYESGVEHQDARRQLSEKLISGELKSWGLRQIKTHIPNQFEHSLREIAKEYWDGMQLDYQSCLYYRGPYSQTMKIPGRSEIHHWADLRVSKVQVRQIWTIKPLWLRIYRKITRKPRIAHVQSFRVGSAG